MGDLWRRLALGERLSLTLLLLAITWLLIYTDWAWRFDQLLYDTHHKVWSRDAPEDVVIIGIDTQSLEVLGRWPWPRRTHAALLDRLSTAGARVVVLDVIFAEPDPDDPAGDKLLAAAMQHHGAVIVPVLLEERRSGGQLIETLPAPPFAQAAARLGHPHVELDADGIARGAYLREGLGAARWPALGVAALELLQPERSQALPGERNPVPDSGSPFVWERDHHVMIPYAGPAGHYAHVSYMDVLRGRIPDSALRGKVVFVGATATGLGDALPTPVSGLNHPMPGVEINANIFTALRDGTLIEPAAQGWRWIVGTLLVLIPALLFPHLAPRYTLLSAAALLLGALLLSAALLRLGQIWLPPAAPFLALSLAYPLWSWRRLEYAMRYLTQELQRLDTEPTLATTQPPALEATLEFLQRLMPVAGWVLYSADGRFVTGWGEQPGTRPAFSGNGEPATGIGWQRTSEGEYWAEVMRDGTNWLCGVKRHDDTTPSAREGAMLLELVRPYAPAAAVRADSITELMQARIQQVQNATQRLRALRRFITDSLAGMADGVVVCNNLGQTLLVNLRAVGDLGLRKGDSLTGRPLLELLSGLVVDDVDTWNDAIRRALIDTETVQISSRNRRQRDLLVQLAPLALDTGRVRGLIITIADITPLKDSERKRSEALDFLSHDLRSPLVSLLALIAHTRDLDVPPNTAMLQRAEDYAQRTLELADSFLQLSRAESPEPIVMEPVNFADVAFQAYDLAWSRAQAQQVTLVDHYSQVQVWTRGDAQLLERAVVNLLTNAIDYSPASTSVTLSLDIEEKELRCCVQDTGPGIAENDLPHLFDRFRRGKRSAESGERGTGLGLAFVKAVAVKHGGRINVESQLGVGSTFCLTLPMIPPPNP